MANNNTPAVRLMTKPEAVASRDKINESIGKGAAHIGEANREAARFIHEEGWRALGYKSWEACIDKEFKLGRSRIYQLLDEKAVAEELERTLAGSSQGVSGRALEALKDVPPGSRGEVLAAAEKEHGPAPSGAKIRSTATKWAASGAGKKKPAKKTSKVETIGEQAKGSERLHKALMTIGDVCGRAFRKALEDDTVELSKADVIALADFDDDRMREIEKLVSTNRWTVGRAEKFLDKMPELTDRIEVLTHLALASLDDEWKGDFGAFTITCKVHRRKLKE